VNLWEQLSPVFKAEVQEAYHFFSMQSENSTVDANGLLHAIGVAHWPIKTINQL